MARVRKVISTRSRHDPYGGWVSMRGSRRGRPTGSLHVDFGPFSWLFRGKRLFPRHQAVRASGHMKRSRGGRWWWV